MLNRKISVIAVGLIAIMGLTACDSDSFKTRPRRKETSEYDCKKHALDKICAVPWKDKIVLYCHKDKVPRVVRTREECLNGVKHPKKPEK